MRYANEVGILVLAFVTIATGCSHSSVLLSVYDTSENRLLFESDKTRESRLAESDGRIYFVIEPERKGMTLYEPYPHYYQFVRIAGYFDSGPASGVIALDAGTPHMETYDISSVKTSREQDWLEVDICGESKAKSITIELRGRVAGSIEQLKEQVERLLEGPTAR